jgi:hypothetical protein
MPALAEELMTMVGIDYDDDLPDIQDTLIPQGAFLTIGMLPWEKVNLLRLSASFHQEASETVPQKGDGLPIVLVQTSQPKGKALIQALQAAGGLKGICFNSGNNAYERQTYDIGLLQLENGEMQLFGEFLGDDPVHVNARRKWDQRCKATEGHCGLIVAKGLTGAARGNPQLKDMIALLETKAISEEELGMGTLEMHVEIDWL